MRKPGKRAEQLRLGRRALDGHRHLTIPLGEHLQRGEIRQLGQARAQPLKGERAQSSARRCARGASRRLCVPPMPSSWQKNSSEDAGGAPAGDSYPPIRSRARHRAPPTSGAGSASDCVRPALWPSSHDPQRRNLVVTAARMCGAAREPPLDSATTPAVSPTTIAAPEAPPIPLVVIARMLPPPPAPLARSREPHRPGAATGYAASAQRRLMIYSAARRCERLGVAAPLASCERHTAGHSCESYSWRRRAAGASAGLVQPASVGLIVVPGATISSMRSSSASSSCTSAAPS